MPAYDKLEEGGLDALMAYLGALRELDSVGSIVEPPPARPKPGD